MELLKEFYEPDRKYSLLAFWFLNGELKEENLRWQINQMVEKGVYGGFMHPRAYLKTPYLEQEWWDAISVCVEEARKLGFQPWLYDEYAWPSGTAGSTFEYGFQKPSRILEQGSANMAKGLYARIFTDKAEALSAEPQQEDDQLIQICEKNGKYYAFYRRIFPKAVDYLRPEVIREFLRLTHEEYRHRYGEDFGNLIPGIFFDEIYMMGNPIPWTEALQGRFEECYGYNLMDELPCLIDGEGKRDRQVRKDYFALIATMYEEAFFKQISMWCESNRLQLTGHTEEFLWEHPRRQGDYFKTMRHLMIPGADCHDYRYRYPRKITYCEPKYAVSVARAYGKERAMSEALGGAGWNCAPEEFKKGINTLAAMGINMFILHGFYYECEHQGSQSDWPTSFFYQNPYWKYFKIFSSYVQRICYLNSIGTPVVRYGLVYPIELMQSHMANGEEDREGTDISNRFHTVLNTMLEHQMDVDMIDTECLIKSEIRESRLCMGQQRFELLLLPQCLEMDQKLEQKLSEWQQSGGKLVFYKTVAETQIPEAFSSCPLCEPEMVTECVSEMVSPCVTVQEGETDGIFVNHRRAEEMSYYFICNSTEEVRCLKLKFSETVLPVCLNIETGNVVPMDARIMPDNLVTTLTLMPNEAVYIVFESGKYIAYNMQKKTVVQEQWITGKWEFLPLSPSCDEQWSIDENETILEIPIAGITTDLSDDYQEIRICNSKEEQGNAARHFSLWNANWITRRPSWNDQISASELYFCKQITLDGEAETAEFCVAAVDTFYVYINGVLANAAESNGIPMTFSCKDFLKQGNNLIAVYVKNHKPLNDVYVCSAEELPTDRFISILLQGRIITEGRELLVASDDSWTVTDQYVDGWNFDASVSGAESFDVQNVKNFNQSKTGHAWIPAWERGKPPLKPWGDLPLYGEIVKYPVNLYYTVRIPTGADRILKPCISGAAVCYLDGKKISWEQGGKDLQKNHGLQTLTITVRAEAKNDGLLAPVSVVMRPYRMNLMDWSHNGIPWFSGRCKYTNTFFVNLSGNRYMLDLGKVNFCAEIWINRRLTAVKIWSPYRIDVSEYLRDGENEVTIVVANLASNERRHMLVDEGQALGWNRYWNEDNMDRDSQNYVSGLLGPVRLIEVNM